MDLFLEIVITAALVISGIFGLVGSFGLLKLRETMQRLHAPTKATTLGVGGVLIASMAATYRADGQISVHELLVTLFLMLTAPITANFIAKTYMQVHLRPRDLPAPGGEHGWSLYEKPPSEKHAEE
ncbi:Na+/H+ antiporter subunit G [Pseudooceanicola algae]|uniref:Uncharacterized protein n=1 Tax=Pseudooceanicola algae TaxID=1537215 RepID=A0A418SBR2_9RHOB|nr:Na+/H+ antiporter subunit G [Pseudooceanicola algae]QPM92534.1 hypothetical protein PSAL_037980 [Pseudooceanicola algae]